jgi:hypothetical protein
MSGKSKPQGPPVPADPPKAKGGEGKATDDCDLTFEVDLVSLRPAFRYVARGDVLDVGLVEEQNLEAVVCTRPVERDVVGSLAAFEGLTKLMDCIRRGNGYVADAIAVSRTSCRVKVRRVSK